MKELFIAEQAIDCFTSIGRTGVSAALVKFDFEDMNYRVESSMVHVNNVYKLLNLFLYIYTATEIYIEYFLHYNANVCMYVCTFAL